MKTFAPLVFLAPLALAAPAASPTELVGRSSPSAVYFLENNPSGNNIVALNVGSNGELSAPVTTSTGGNGAIGINASSGQQVSVDSMFSSGAVSLDVNSLFTVNAGSNTASSFNVDASDPTSLSLVGTPVDTLGDFPNSITYSVDVNLACVSNTGATNGVTCFNFYTNTGLVHNTTLMASGLVSQTTPPKGPANTLSKVEWNPTSEFLILTVKGDPASNTTGKFIYFPWNTNTGTFGTPVPSSFDNVYLPFGFSFISDNEIWAADPGFGGALITFNSAGQATQIAHTPLVNEQTTCWTQWSPSLQKLYTMAAGSNYFYEVSANGTAPGTINNGNPGPTPGTFDSVVLNGLLYALVGEPGVSVIDLSSNSPLLYFSTSSVAPSRQYYQGMASWPNQS